MKKNIVLLDGAIGTSLWAIAEREGVEKVPVWRYNIEHPEFVHELLTEYVHAGSRIILPNTFSANGPVVRRAAPQYTAPQIVRAGVEIAKSVTKGTDVRVAMSAGPLPQLMEPWGDLTEDEVDAVYTEQLEAGVKAGADLIMLQTFIDLGMMEVAVRAAKRLGVPVMATMTFEKVGKTMFGNSVRQVCDSLGALGADAIGMNCSLGPDLALPVIREFAENTKLPLVFKPNAGLPITAADGTTVADYDADTFVREVEPALDCADYIGGCCGCGPEYIRRLKARMDELTVKNA